MKQVQLQAHKGVATECPENTMPAFFAALTQGYDVIELDLGYTKDHQIVVLHDPTINRTARTNAGEPLGKSGNITDITYKEALNYDFGISFSNKFCGTRIPLLSEVLEFAKKHAIRLKIDNKIERFPPHMLSLFFSQIKPYTKWVSITSMHLDFIKNCLSRFPDIAIDYDGVVNETVLKELSTLRQRDTLTVWLPYKCARTAWVKIPFADEALSALVHKYAKLGIWLISNEPDFADAVNRLGADIVETDGTIKPPKNINCRFDMHTHTQNSHDSQCDVSDMASAEQKNNVCGFAITDHCDIACYAEKGFYAAIDRSVNDAQSVSGVVALKGIEIGEGFWHPGKAKEIISRHAFDVVLGSVHTVLLDGYTIPYSQIDFANMDQALVTQYLDQYFDDILSMLNMCDIDILAHLTCPLRYINGKYNLGADCHRYEDKIKEILHTIITRGIALEINTSCMSANSNYCEWMPEEWIVALYKQMGGYLITTGSDAHIAKNAANSFDKLYAMLKTYGFKNSYFYKNRCAIPCAIN